MSEQRLIDANKLTVTHINEVDVLGYKLKYGTGIPVVRLAEIEHAPTIEERKTGKWIIEPYDAQNDIFIHRCGTCMRVAMLGGHTTKYKYCPLCGSAMEGEDNDG